jgi:hypothetical protein
MKNRTLTLMTALLTLACLAAPLAAQTAAKPAAKAKPVDMKKLIAEIVGDWDFSFQGQTMTIQFTEQDGKLMAAPVGETPEEIKPVAGKPLCFDITVAANGQYYEIQFARDDKGVLNKCVMSVAGMTAEGVKVIK